MLRSNILALFAAAACAATAAQVQSQWVNTSTHSYLPMPANSLTDGRISCVSWSPDGEHLLVGARSETTSREQVLRFDGTEPTYSGLQILSWDRRFHQIRSLWSTEAQSVTVDHVAWLKGSPDALITLRWLEPTGGSTKSTPHFGVLWVDTISYKFRWLPGLERLLSRPSISPSPSLSLAAIRFCDTSDPKTEPSVPSSPERATGDSFQAFVKISGTTTLESGNLSTNYNLLSNWIQPEAEANHFWTVDASGNTIHAINLEKPLQLRLVWNQGGSAWFLLKEESDPGQRVLNHLTDQGRLEPTTEQEFAAAEAHPDLSVISVSGMLKQGKSGSKFTSLWITGTGATDHSELLLAVEGEWPELSPTNSGVFYIEAGVAKVRELIRLTDTQKRSAEEATRTPQSSIPDISARIIYLYSGNANPPNPRP